MKRFVVNPGLITIGLLALSGPIGAQSVLDQGKSLLGGSGTAAAPTIGGVGGQTSSLSGIAGSLPLDKIMALVQQQGYSNITGLAPSPKGGTLQASAVNSSGNPVSLLINPTTGNVISALMK